MSVTAANHLPVAREHVVEAELCCSAQRLRIARLAAGGGDTASAEAQLVAFEETLAQMQAHLQILQAEPGDDLPPTDDLVLVLRHVAGAKAGCARQAARVAHLRADGHGTAEDEVVLGVLRQSVVLMRAHQLLLQVACEVP